MIEMLSLTRFLKWTLSKIGTELMYIELNWIKMNLYIRTELNWYEFVIWNWNNPFYVESNGIGLTSNLYGIN